MAIRTMAKAEYSTNNIGHFGLAFEYYSHFTSPIRRYPDVMAHRLLQHYLDGGNSVNPNDYEVKCKHSSLMEKRASEAERASIKYKQVEYMLDHTGKIFEGIVSGLTSWGFYVEVGETKSEGMVSLRNLADDHYEFDADKYIIRGLRSRTELHMGDKVTIKVMGGNLNQRTLDYQWVKK
jgi:VacB/RNase II family 3'-5' exoribonuclease